MKAVGEDGQLHFVDSKIFDSTYNTLVIGKMGKGAAFHRELQLYLPAPKNQNNLFPRVLTFEEEMVITLQNYQKHQKKLRHIHSLIRAEKELYRNIFGLMW